MVRAKNSSTMDLLQDSNGNISILEMKASTSGNKIVSNSIFNNHFSSKAQEQESLPKKIEDITTDSLNEKDIYLSLGEDELCKMVTDMVENEHTLSLPASQNLSPESLVQRNIIQEQAQLLSSYNNILDLPKDVQRQIMIKPEHKKETMDIGNTQEVHKSHLLPWVTKEYTKLIHPSKDSHMITIKKKEHKNVSHHTIITPLLSNKEIEKNILSRSDNYHKTISDPSTIDIKESNSYLDENTEATKESNKNEVTITRIRGDHKSHNKEIKNDLKKNQQLEIVPMVQKSMKDVLNPTDGNSLKADFSFNASHPLKIDEKSKKLENLSEVAMSNCNKNIVLHPPIPIFTTGALSEAKPSTSTDKTREQMIMIRELQTMVPPNIYPQQSLKTFENGNVLLIAPITANKSNCPQRFIQPKAAVSNIKLDQNITGGKVDEKDAKDASFEGYKHGNSLHNSMPKLDETGEQDKIVRNILPNKRKLSDDSLLYDMRIGLEGIEMKGELHYEDNNTFREKKKRCRNGIKKEKKWQLEEELSDAEEEKKRQNAKKAKEHREKKKDEISALKKQSMDWQLRCRELEAENKQLKSQVEMLKSIFPMLNVNKIPET